MSVPDDPYQPPNPATPGGSPPPAPGPFGSPPAPGPFGSPPAPGPYGTPPAPQYGAPPAGGYGAQPPGQYGAPQGQYGAPGPSPYGQPTGPVGLQRAGFGRRLGAFIVDAIIVGIVSSVLASLLGFDPGSAGGGGNLVNMIVAVLYWGLLEGYRQGQTVGKQLLGIATRDITTGAVVPLNRAMIRALGRILSGAVCLLGYLWMLWDANKQTWHDKFANTTVVRL